MLQYPISMPNLSLRSKDPQTLISQEPSDHPRRRHHNNRSAMATDLMLSVYLPPSVTASSRSPSNRLAPYSARLPPSSPIPRSPVLSSLDTPSANASSYTSRPASTLSAPMQDILFPGDVIGQGLYFNDERVRLLPISAGHHSGDDDLNAPSIKFEVVRALGTGSYAVVYQVRQILSGYPPQTEDLSPISAVDFDDIPSSAPSPVRYGREYALKCLSKADLDKDALSAQMFEATIHQSLPTHPNIVTLYRTLETSSYLLLLLEYVPGEDLFYFLEKSCDHYEPEPPTSESTESHTPPTPSLLSSLNPDQLLSRTRLRLISSMFAQMCQAVAACHAAKVFHRDIKPENFIVTDGWVESPDGKRERKVVVKLTDFGLSTNEVESADMDCGSAPYMSYECRNNVAPTYSPRAADVWSLGIVFINMVYHYNPWTDTAEGACSSFELYRREPVNFFMQRFTGMTMPVARFLAHRVFCILGDSSDDSPRVSAEEFGAWAKDLPAHFSVPGHARAVSISSTQGHPLASGLPQSRPASRQASVNNAVPRRGSRSASRPPSFAHGFVETELPTVLDNDNEGEVQEEPREEEPQPDSRTSSTMKRRKRGARKNKGKDVQPEPVDLTLETLAEASQSLAREISRSSKVSGNGYVIDPVPPVPPIPPEATLPTPTVTKKPSKWKLIIGKSNGDRSPTIPAPSPPVEEPIAVDGGRQMSKTASNVTNLVLGLGPPLPKPSRPPARQHTPGCNGPTQSAQPFDDSTCTRGRRKNSPYGNSGGTGSHIERWADNVDKRGVSPTSTRSGRYLASSASSMASSNWRSSISTTNSIRSPNTSSSAFTRYPNNSASTVATSMSSGSWRNTNGSKYSINNGHYNHRNCPPANVKIMTGIPGELVEPPRQVHQNTVSGRKRGSSNGGRNNNQTTGSTTENNKLDTICERPTGQSMDASTSTTDLSNGGSAGRDGDLLDGAGPKKVQKGQINALAKMLSALRR